MNALECFIKSLPPADKINIKTDIVNVVQKIGIKVVYEPSLITEKKGRIMLSTQRFNADFRDPLVRECGGVIIASVPQQAEEQVEARHWRIVSTSPPPFNPKVALNRMKLSEYNISYINEGTTITLYYYNDKWCIATTNGYEMNNQIWSGKKTYSQVFDEILAEYPDFKYDTLDKNVAYTIGFHHPDFHPFKGTGEREKHAWMIYTTSPTEVQIGIPHQKRVTGILEIQEYIDLSKNSMDKYIEDRTVLYGFIFRHKTNHYGQFSSVIMESRLLKRIREIVYNDKTGRLDPHNAQYIGSEKRMSYIALKSYLDINNREIFIMLFPQFQNDYNRYEKSIAELAKRIIEGKESKTECMDNEIRTVLKNRHKLTVTPTTSVDVVIDLITSVEWLDSYFLNFNTF